MRAPDTKTEKGHELTHISMHLSEIAAVKQHFTNGAPYWPRISLTMCSRLMFFKDCRHSAEYVRDEIEILEGLRAPGNTKPTQPFKRSPLRGLWHKHFCTPRHIIRNIGERWGLTGQGNEDLEKQISDTAAKYGDQRDVWPGVLAHKIIIDGLIDRSDARRMTGDWIIFGKNSAGENVYLDVATHEEGRQPQRLMQKLAKGCEWEFPELFPETNVTS